MDYILKIKHYEVSVVRRYCYLDRKIVLNLSIQQNNRQIVATKRANCQRWRERDSKVITDPGLRLANIRLPFQLTPQLRFDFYQSTKKISSNIHHY
jgi:hypothetical protein